MINVIQCNPGLVRDITIATGEPRGKENIGKLTHSKRSIRSMNKMKKLHLLKNSRYYNNCFYTLSRVYVHSDLCNGGSVFLCKGRRKARKQVRLRPELLAFSQVITCCPPGPFLARSGLHPWRTPLGNNCFSLTAWHPTYLYCSHLNSTSFPLAIPTGFMFCKRLVVFLPTI